MNAKKEPEDKACYCPALNSNRTKILRSESGSKKTVQREELAPL